MHAPGPGLGAAEVTEAAFAGIVATYFGVPTETVEVLGRQVEPVPYDLPAITTAGRHWVSGTARVVQDVQPFRFFVKHIQSWSRHPFFAFVPDELRELAVAGVPWRTEAMVYRSDLRDRLPAGLTMARPLGVFDLDQESASIWLEEVPTRDVAWDRDRYAAAALLLGRLAASPEVAPLAGVGDFPWSPVAYVEGRLTHQILPMLRDPELWEHPLMAPFQPVREPLLGAADRAEAYGEELAALPRLSGHGDACPSNLLAGEGDDLVLIDFGFWNALPVGFDLGQLLAGEVQLGRQPASTLAETDAAIVAAYIDGLRAEGCEIPEETVRRAHAVQLLLFTGLSSFPEEHLGSPLTPELEQLAAERAALCEFSLDLVSQSKP